MVDRSIVYKDAELFFQLNGSSVMKLTTNAAVNVCQLAAKQNIRVNRVEGGIWHSPGFESRLDCIWDAKDWLKGNNLKNNMLAIDFIREEAPNHQVFIVSIEKVT